ncbi:MAG: magnesium/cobalt transporter CorA [Paludibacter sp.]|nr:magnesium/cobalt transporter CorA [Paludibacter sp.]MBP8782596.1 magnesium/cobalt transporter CorA [Paludibacter sp.]
MSRYTRKKKEDIGLSPYALIFRGQKKAEHITITAMDFDQEEVREFGIERTEKISALLGKANLSWLNIDGLHDEKRIEEIGALVGVPFHILSDILNPSLRPKVQEFDNGVFITLKMLQFKEEGRTISVENLSLILTQGCLLSFQEQKGDVFNPVRERIRKHKNKIRTSGVDYLAFALLDVVVDNYIYIIGLLGEKIENLEDKMTDEPRKELLDEINDYKKELNLLRKNIKPAREMILSLVKLESEILQEENRFHFRELQDNITEAGELSDSYREILYDQLNIYHTVMSTRLNDIMRTLTIFSVMFIPLTFIVGVYGTNFDYVPELHWQNGYFIMWVVMVVVAIVMFLLFRRKKWF